MHFYSRLSAIEERLDRIYDKNYKFTVKKAKKKGSFSIKEGIVSFSVNFNPKPYCSLCNLRDNLYWCDHVYYILNNQLKLNDLIISYLCISDIYNKFLDMLKEKLDPDKLQEIILEYLSDKICGICHNDLVEKKYGQHLFFCYNCKNLVHSKCMDTWMNKKIKVGSTNVEKGCIYCKNKNIFV